MNTSKVVIIATLTAQQLQYLQNLATENGITAEYVVEGFATEEVEETPSSTPLTGAMLDEVATLTGKTVLEVATIAAQQEITTVEEALAADLPSNIKELLENYL
jgi:hypothetical protein